MPRLTKTRRVLQSLFKSQQKALITAYFVAPIGVAIWGAISSLIFARGDIFGPFGRLPHCFFLFHCLWV